MTILILTEERKRKSADESSADEANAKKNEGKAPATPDVISPKKFKDDLGKPNAKVDNKNMPRPARKSSRNASTKSQSKLCVCFIKRTIHVYYFYPQMTQI